MTPERTIAVVSADMTNKSSRNNPHIGGGNSASRYRTGGSNSSNPMHKVNNSTSILMSNLQKGIMPAHLQNSPQQMNLYHVRVNSDSQQ